MSEFNLSKNCRAILLKLYILICNDKKKFGDGGVGGVSHLLSVATCLNKHVWPILQPISAFNTFKGFSSHEISFVSLDYNYIMF